MCLLISTVMRLGLLIHQLTSECRGAQNYSALKSMRIILSSVPAEVCRRTLVIVIVTDNIAHESSKPADSKRSLSLLCISSQCTR